MTAETYSEKLGGSAHSKRPLRLWLRLLSCATVMEKIVRGRLASEFDSTLPRFDVLATLERAPDGLQMGDLSRSLLVSNGNVTGIVERLTQEGHLTKHADPDDRRSVRVALTAKGRRHFAKMASAHEKWIEEMLNELEPDEMTALLGLLLRVRRSVEVTRKQA